jgi:hypothetical protein
LRILLVADGRSPTTRGWLKGLNTLGAEVILVSTFPCPPVANLTDQYTIPVAFSRWVGNGQPPVGRQSGTIKKGSGRVKQLVGRFRSLFLAGRYILGPLSLHLSKDISQFRRIVVETHPDLIHALRIPFEGMLASYGLPEIPLILSIWGNDLTLHAHGSPWMGSLTRHSLAQAQGLLADAGRDLRLALSWGYAAGKPSLVVPGSGGLDLEEIARYRGFPSSILPSFPPGTPLVVNPRGLRPGSLRTDTFFKSIPLVLNQIPQAIFLCPSMAGQVEAVRWVHTLGIRENVFLLPSLSQSDLWGIFHKADVFVSPGIHDGTPNSFLEAIACGCFPVVGDIESLRDWITPELNGLLFDPADPSALAAGILKGLGSSDLRDQAAEMNAGLVAERVEINRVREKVGKFYHLFL